MAVEACMNPKLMVDDSEDDEPLVFRRNKTNSGLKDLSSSLRIDKQPGKPGSDVGTLNGMSSRTQKGNMTQSLKPSSSSRPTSVMQKSPPPSSRPQKSPQNPSASLKSLQHSSATLKSSQHSSLTVQSPQHSSATLKPSQHSYATQKLPLLSGSRPSLYATPRVSSANGAPSANHQTKKNTMSVVREEKPTPIKGKSLKDESEDSEDDVPIGKSLSHGSQNGNSNSVAGEGKLLNGVVEDSDSDSDSDDDKPLSARMPNGLFKGGSSDRGRDTSGPLHTQKPKPVNVKLSNVSDDEKPISHKMKSMTSSSKETDDSDDDKPLASRMPLNGFVKKENQIKKTPVTSTKRPSAETISVQSLNKKMKLSNASASASAKQFPVKSEVKDDDEDHIPIAQRMNKAATTSKAAPIKKKVAKVESKLKKVNFKSKKIMKKSKYSKSSNLLPDSGEGQKWTTLEHNGVIFPPPYQPHGIKILYDGEPVDLTPEQEEVATMYAVMLDTDYAKKDKFNENFFSDWKKLLGRDHFIQDLKKCDFTPIHQWHLREKEKKKQMSTEEKKALKEEKLEQEEKYKWAILDGVKEQVGNFRVEPPGLFRGRGEHPKMGRLKKRIQPSDITINIGKGAPIPECPILGQRWKEVRHDNTVTWLAFWNDPINPKMFKYVFLASTSSLKTKSDQEKYEKARKLKDYIDGIRAAYTKDFTSKDMTKRQIAVATYLIDRLALRAGNDKDDDEADTVGCCTLKVENVKPIPPNILEFDFLGKDSIKYYKQFEAEPLVYKAVEQFRKGKSGSDDLFDQLDTSKLNAHLKELMPGLTAKVFRTFNASYTLDDMLVKGAGFGEVQEKIAIYQHANKEVAIICNHQRTVSKSHSAQMERLMTKINEAKAELSELETDLARAKKGKPPLTDSDGKRKRSLTPEAIEKKIFSTKTKIDKYERDMQSKEDLKEIALGTSKINYLDPRITVAWCKRNEVPIEKIFNKSLLAKFSWAMNVDPSFRF